MKRRKNVLTVLIASAVCLGFFGWLMPDRQRLRWLEKNGEVPQDAGLRDWQLAQKTSWWGKPIDAKEFWKGRVLWLDEATETAAQRHGRQFPPLPYEDPSFPAINDEGINWDWATPEGPDLHYASSSKERAFWDRFSKTHPRPPDDLERQQYSDAARLLGLREDVQRGRSSSYLTSERLAEMGRSAQRNAAEVNYPSEAFSDEALFWCYVLRERGRYQRLLNESGSIGMESWLRGLSVDQKFIVEPLTEDQLQAANAWKIIYLQRLRRENADEQYIQAYLKTWNLREDEVFGAAVNQH